MPKELFDLERVRKNWLLPPEDEASPPLEQVRALALEQARPLVEAPRPEEARAQEASRPLGMVLPLEEPGALGLPRALETPRALEPLRGQEAPDDAQAPAAALVPRAASLDPLGEAGELLNRMEALCAFRFPAQRDTLGAFFREARELLEAQRRGSPEDARAEPLVALQSTLDKLEELLEVFTLGNG